MPSFLSSPWFKVLIPLVGIVVALLVGRLRGASFQNDLGFRWPTLPVAAYWLAIWAVLMVAGEWATRAYGLADAKPWDTSDGVTVVLRIAALALLGPILEELMFRGFLFWRLAPLAGPASAVIILAAGWAVMHYRYGLASVLLVFADGICLGLARWRSGSLFLAMGMHALGNSISVTQSLTR